jgi:hypothetical protein
MKEFFFSLCVTDAIIRPPTDLTSAEQRICFEGYSFIYKNEECRIRIKMTISKTFFKH